MSGWEKISCPKCGSGNVARSHWRSRGEKHGNPGHRPARCRDCDHRFLAPMGHGNKARLVVSTIVALTVVAGGTALFLRAVAPETERAPQPASPEAISLTITPVAMKAAEAGDAEAQFAVATSMLADAELNLAYSTKAIEFLTRAAEQGHARAMLRLGLLYRQGVGALQNFSQAALWIEKAARLGEPQAMLEFGRLHREGVGMAKDPIKAYVWLNRAAAARDPQAIRERAEVARLLTEAELKKAQDESAVDLPSSEQAAAPKATPASSANP